MENIPEIKDNIQEKKNVDEKQVEEINKNTTLNIKNEIVDESINNKKDNQENKNQKNDNEDNIQENKEPKTTLLLDKSTDNTNNNIFGIIIYFISVGVVGYFISKTDNIKYKIGFIIVFLLITFFIKKKFMKYTKTVMEDNGQNLIEG
jgi:hypothetical protein